MRGVLSSRLQAAMFDEVGADGFQYSSLVRRTFGQVAPNRLGPAGVIRRAANDVQVQLRHEIAEGAEVDFWIFAFGL